MRHVYSTLEDGVLLREPCVCLSGIGIGIVASQVVSMVGGWLTG